jgi:hypothetical protein
MILGKGFLGSILLRENDTSAMSSQNSDGDGEVWELFLWQLVS